MIPIGFSYKNMQTHAQTYEKNTKMMMMMMMMTVILAQGCRLRFLGCGPPLRCHGCRLLRSMDVSWLCWARGGGARPSGGSASPLARQEAPPQSGGEATSNGDATRNGPTWPQLGQGATCAQLGARTTAARRPCAVWSAGMAVVRGLLQRPRTEDGTLTMHITRDCDHLHSEKTKMTSPRSKGGASTKQSRRGPTDARRPTSSSTGLCAASLACWTKCGRMRYPMVESIRHLQERRQTLRRPTPRLGLRCAASAVVGRAAAEWTGTGSTTTTGTGIGNRTL